MRQLLFLLAFLCLFVAGDRLGGYLFQRQTAQSLFRYSRLYEDKTPSEILVLGNSRGLMYYQPHLEQVSGFRSTNLSYNGLSADIAAALCADHLERHPETKLLLLDITMLDRENDELLCAFAPYLRYSKRLDSLLHHRQPKVWYGTQISHLFRYNNEVFQRAFYYRNRDDKDWLLDRVITERLAAERDKQVFEFKENPYLVEQLKGILAVARQKNVAVRLLIGPYFPGFKPVGLDKLRENVENATGMTVHDYRYALTERTDFGDLMHPNKQGSIRYLDRLRDDGLLSIEPNVGTDLR
jgi:hypothetical protein